MIATRPILACMASGAVLAAGVLGSAPDHATPLSFIAALNQHGSSVYDTVSALTTGYAICDALTVRNGADIAEQLYQGTSFTDVPTRAVAAAWVIVSVEQLCPAMDHRGQVLR